MILKKLIGKNIILSPVSQNEAQQYCEWMNDMSLTNKLAGSHFITTLDSEINWINSKNSGRDICFSIYDKESMHLIGNISLAEMDHIFQTASLGVYIADKNNRHKGYGSEAIILMLDYAFNYLNLNNIMLSVIASNKNAINCYKKLGFKTIGNRRNAIFQNGEKQDIIFMDILRQDFIK